MRGEKRVDGQSFHLQNNHWDFSPKSPGVHPQISGPDPLPFSVPKHSQLEQPVLAEFNDSSDSGSGLFLLSQSIFFFHYFQKWQTRLVYYKIFVANTHTHKHTHLLAHHPTHSSRLCKNLKLLWCEGQETGKLRHPPGQMRVYITLWALDSAQFCRRKDPLSWEPGGHAILEMGKLRHGGA